MLLKQNKAAVNYDRNARSKRELSPGENMRLYDKRKKRWEPAKVTGVAQTPRTYYVQRMDGGTELRRNRLHLKPTVECWDNHRFCSDAAGDVDVDPQCDDELGGFAETMPAVREEDESTVDISTRVYITFC